MNNRLNKFKYPGAKRLMLEAQELRDKTEDYCAQPIDDNLFEWHFTVRGPPDTAFEGGFYHGRLSFPTEYPMKPPSIILLTPNGRFETNKKICLSISGYHPETWQPSWSVRTALLALIAFMPTKANRAIGSLDFSDAERRKLARNSKTWQCDTCGLIRDLLKHPEQEENISPTCQASCSGSSCANENVQRFEESTGKSSHSDRSDSDGETRDSITDSQSSTSNGNSDIEGSYIDASSRACNQTQTTVNTSGRTEDESIPDNNLIPNPSDGVEELQSSSTGSLSINPVVDRNRNSYPSLVLVSIFILLFLLILRRIVIIMQS